MEESKPPVAPATEGPRERADPSRIFSPAVIVIALLIAAGAGGLFYLDRAARKPPPPPPPLTDEAKAYVHNLRLSDVWWRSTVFFTTPTARWFCASARPL